MFFEKTTHLPFSEVEVVDIDLDWVIRTTFLFVLEKWFCGDREYP
jgi:hypothetical protein